MKDFFLPINCRTGTDGNDDETIKVASTPASDSPLKPIKSKQSILTELFDVLDINENPSNIEQEMQIDPLLFKTTDMVSLLKSFKSNRQEFYKKSLFQHRSSEFLNDTNANVKVMKELRESFIQLCILCDKEKNMEEAKKLTFAEMGPFLRL